MSSLKQKALDVEQAYIGHPRYGVISKKAFTQIYLKSDVDAAVKELKERIDKLFTQETVNRGFVYDEIDGVFGTK